MTTANETDQFVIDYFLVTPTTGGSDSGVETTRSIPSSTMVSAPGVATPPTGAIVGGVIGATVGISILVIALWCFLKRRSRGGQAHDVEKPSPADIPAGEGLYMFHRLCRREIRRFTQALLGHVEPSNAAAITPALPSAGLSGPGPQSTHSDGSSNQPLNPAVRQSIVSSIPSHSQHTQSDPNEGSST